MERTPTPRELAVAARACTIMAYAGGLAGIAAGTLLMRDGELAFAVIIWTMTFAIGAVLMAVALLVRALSGISAQLARIDGEVRALTDGSEAGHQRDPWTRH